MGLRAPGGRSGGAFEGSVGPKGRLNGIPGESVGLGPTAWEATPPITSRGAAKT